MDNPRLSKTRKHPPKTEAVVQMRNVEKVYDQSNGIRHVVLKNVNLDLYAGKIDVVVGRNAVGKSTILRILAGIEPATAGVVEFMPGSDERPPIAIAFQEVDESLLPWRTNLRNITFGLEALGTPLEDAKRKAEDFVKHYELPLPLEQYPSTSSGGQRQMVAVVRTALIKPKLLLLDEPLSKVDPSQVWFWRSFLMQYVSDQEPACLIVTHSLDDAIYTADVVHVLARESDTQGARIRKSYPVGVDREERSSWRATTDYHELRQQIADAIELGP